jgi:hypothetical protein
MGLSLDLEHGEKDGVDLLFNEEVHSSNLYFFFLDLTSYVYCFLIKFNSVLSALVSIL